MFSVSRCGPSKGTLRCFTSICDGIIFPYLTVLKYFQKFSFPFHFCFLFHLGPWSILFFISPAWDCSNLFAPLGFECAHTIPTILLNYSILPPRNLQIYPKIDVYTNYLYQFLPIFVKVKKPICYFRDNYCRSISCFWPKARSRFCKKASFAVHSELWYESKVQ